jgi:hypothetical protein
MANDLAGRWLDRALAGAAEVGPRLAPKGECYYCGESFKVADPLESKKLYCDADCASAHDRENRLKNLR